MKIHISHSTKVLLEHRPYEVVERGKIEIKGKGEMKTYFVLNKFDNKGNPIKFPFQEIFEKFKLKEEKSSKTNGTADESSSNKGSATFFERDSGEKDVEFFHESTKSKSQSKSNYLK